VRRASLLGALVCASCIELLEPGELGELRVLGDIRGEVPLPVTAPIADRNGNIYVLVGTREMPEVSASVARFGGGWTGGCRIHEGTMSDTHGWIGASEDRAWYWSGTALVQVDGETGSCKDVLDTDPATAADLLFVGVAPAIRETPSRTTVVAMIQSPSDAVPFTSVVDLDLGVYTDLRRFDPANAIEPVVLGTGSDPEIDGAAIFVVRYTLGEAVRVEARFVAPSGETTDVAPLEGIDDTGANAIAGFVQSAGDKAAGVLGTGALVVFDRVGGRVRDTMGIEAVGVHRDGARLWVVGIKNARPAIGEIGPSGDVSRVVAWTSSENTANRLARGVSVLDDRVQPIATRRWTDARASTGPWPFVQPESPFVYGDGVTLLMIAGTTFETGGMPFTEIAVGPAGIEYP
jgi:hypothetical protein